MMVSRISRAVLLQIVIVSGGVAIALAEELKDIKGPLKLPINWTIIIIALSAVVLIAGIIVFLFIRKRKPMIKTVPEIRKTSWEVALNRIELLERGSWLSRGEFKMFYFELSDIVRQYIENRFSIKAPEMTTEEFLIFIKTSSQLNEVQKDILKEFLTSCDMVKFAKHTPQESEAKGSIAIALRLVNETKGNNA